VVFIPAFDAEVDVQRNPRYIRPERFCPEVGNYAVTVATFVPQQDIRESIPVTDDDLLLLDDDEEAEECD
jgi:hypothetical protein